MQRVGAAGGPGPIGFQGPPRSLKISPVNIQDEPADPTQRSNMPRDCHAKICSRAMVTAVYGPFGRYSSYEKVQKARTGPDRIGSAWTDVRVWLWSAPGARPSKSPVSGLQHRSIGRGVLCFPLLDPSNEKDHCRCGSRRLIALGSLIKKCNRRSDAVRYVRFIVVLDLTRTIFPLGEIATGSATGGHPEGNTSLCVGCGGRIHDQWILRVAPNLEWHAACLKCAECQQFLDEKCTCFVRDGKTYCKRDYVRLFGTKCDKCSRCFSKNDYVMRAKTKIYHVECFRCCACSRRLETGDEFALRQDGLFCRLDHDVLEGGKHCTGGVSIPGSENNNNASLTNNNHHLHPNDGSMSGFSTFMLADSGSESGSHKAGVGGVRGSGGHKSGGGSDGKPTRVRTVLNEKQLHTLRTCYAANPRPDALMKEQLVEMTGLSPRVIRVWFQNKRCKDKKKTIAMKQQMQEKDGRKLGFGGMHGIPMVASSPVRHESPIGMTPLEVQAYQPPWKALSEFALHTDLERLDPNAPSFHHLVSQMHGYDLHGGPPPQLAPPPGMLGGPMSDGGGGPLPPPGPHHPGGGGPDMGQHPDSTDSYVTYVESDSDSFHHDTGSP
ncbi:hypothetical protein ALC57_03849 [Trachymyrmex cornetzi]|uniref:Insulin gene enhancer protein ISL-1 n=1 Tax=Trachymyrmex cornetzi TaxID=471704 RepID=A0A195EEZ2_9HYME|nr:hypothetical protein ALC57_03849 [Trachymyrmex cornetzi]